MGAVFRSGVQRHTRSGVLSLTAVLLATLMPLVAPSVARASVQRSFDAVFSTEDNGAITLTGASNMDCPTLSSGCTSARLGTATGTSNNNNVFNMAFVDVDSDSSTSNSSTATLNMPVGSTVLNARLIWGGRSVAGTNGVAPTKAVNTVKFKPPAASGYSTLTATSLIQPTALVATDGGPYQASIDVTSAVQAGGAGVYSVADIGAATGQDRYAGWSLVVAYRNPALPLRNLRVFEGFADITSATGNSSVDIPVSGFLTPTTGNVNASVGVVAWEGDYGTTGDALKLAGTTLSDATRPANNFFDSRISDGGVDQLGRNPANLNNFGVDIGRIATTNVLANGSTSATINLTSSGDSYYPGIVTSQIDLFTPSFNAVSKTVTNLNGNNPAQPGDTLEYKITFANTGADYADTAVVRDVLATGLTYLPGSLSVLTDTGGTTGTRTDATGDDTADYTSADRTVRFRVGSGATASTGGTIAPGGSVVTRFRATVNRAAAGSSIVNTPILDYKARTLGRTYSFSGNDVSTPVSALADLAASKTVAGSTQNAGQNVTYTIAATNNGPNAATGATLVDTLPTGTTYVSATPPAGVTCVPLGQILTCALGTVANGATVSIPVVAKVNSDTAGGVVINSVTASASTADDVSVNNTATAPITVTQSADLAVTSSLTGPVVPGTEQATLTSTVTNNGPSDATGVVLSIPLPDNTYVAWASDGCTVAAGTVTCVVGSLASGASSTVTVVLGVNSGYTGNTVAVTTSASSSTPDSNNSNNSSTATANTAPLADIAVTKTVADNPVPAGTRTTYTIAVANKGPSDAANVVVTDPVPPGVTVVSANPQMGTCTVGASVSCTLGTIPAGTTVTVSLRVGIAVNRAAGPLTNTASATTSTTQKVTTNDSSSVTTTVTRISDLSISKSAIPSPVIAGAPLSYTLAVANNGPSTADSVVVTDTLPAGLTTTGQQSTQGTCTVVVQTITCALGTMAPGATATVTITADTPGIVPLAGFSNTGTVTSASTDPNPANNSATYVSTVTAQSDLSVTQVATAAQVVAGTGTRYTMTVLNNGPSVATGVTSTQTIPTGFVISAITPTSGTCQVVNGQVNCNFGTLATGAAATVTVDVTVPSGQAPATTNSVATVASTTTDPTTSNNTTTTPVAVRTAADVRIANVQTPGTFRAGDPFSRTFSVANSGPSDAQGTVLVADLPAGVLDLAVSLGGVACTVNGGRVTCPIGTMTAGQTLTGTVTGRVAASSPPGPRTFAATISSTTADPVPANNTVAAATAVTAYAQLSIDQTVDPSTLVAGSRATYTVIGTNDGPSDATTVTLTYTAPTSLHLVSAVSSLGPCTIQGQAVTCVLDRLPAGTADNLTIVADVSSTATGTVTTHAQIDTLTPSPGGENQLDTLDAQVVQSADLVLTGTTSANPVRAGTAQTYTLTASNAGPSTATNVVLSDTLPTGLTILSGSLATQTGTCTANPDGMGFNCSFGNLAPGASASVVVSALVPADTAAGTVLTDTAAIGSPTTDPTPDNRAVSLASTVSTEADLAITTTAAGNAEAGSNDVYTITVANNGPSVARSVVIADPLPSGTGFVSADPGCSLVGTAIQCAVGDLTQGAIKTVKVTLVVAPNYSAPTLANTATVSSPTTDPSTANNSSTATQSVSANANLRTAIAITSGPVVAGTPVTYRVTTTNDGPSVAPQVVVADPVPSGTTYVSASPSSGGTCVFSSGAVRCTWPSLAVGQTVTTDITLNVASNTPVGTSLGNTATATSSVPDPNPGDSSATATATVGAVANVSVTQTLTSGPPVAGGKMTWQAVIRNAGPSSAYGIATSDPAPAGVTYSSVSSTVGTCTINGSGAAVCTVGTLASGATATVTLIGALAPDYTGTGVTNTVTVTTTSTDPDTSDNVSSAVSDTSSSADLGLAMTAQPDPVVPGQPVTWTATVTNNGPSTSRGVVVTDDLPAGITPQPQPGCTISGQRVTCTLGDIATGGTATATIRGALAANFSGNTLRNTATVTSGTADPNVSDNTATTATSPNPQADLSVSVVQPTNAVAGQPASWAVRVSDAGPSDAAGTSLTISVPAYLYNAAASWPGGVCTVSGATATCPLGLVGAGQTTEVTLTGTIDAAYNGPLTVGADVVAQTNDPNLANNSANTVSTTSQSADLVSQVTAPDSAVPGTQVSWVLGSRNLGPSTAVGTTLTATLPDGLSGVTATTAAGTCSVSGTTITCPVGDIAPGITVMVNISGTLAANVIAPAVVVGGSASSTVTDPNQANNASTASTPVKPTANLHVAKAVTSGVPVAGAPIAFAIEVSNAGPSDAQSVIVTDSVPTAVSGLVADTPQGTCAITGQDLRCALGTVAAGSPPVTISLRGVLADGAGTSVTNTATVASATPEVDNSDNSGSVTASSTGSADLGVTVTAPGTVTAGLPLTYTVTVTNNGPSTATGSNLTGTLPAALTNVTSDNPNCLNLTTCNLGDIAPNGTVVVHLTGTVDPTTTGTLESRINTGSTVADPDGRNNSVATRVDVTSSADLGATFSVDPQPAVPGTTLLYTATITSQGPSTVDAVVTFSPLPDGTDVAGPITSSQGTCSVIVRSIVCDLGPIVPGAVSTVQIPVLLSPSYSGGNLVNTLSVQASTNDPNPGNNSANAETTVVPQADLALALAGPGTVTPGSPAHWDLTVVNHGPSDAPVTLVQDLPTAVGDISVVTSQGTCTVTGQQLRCDLGTVGATGTVTIGVDGIIDPDTTTPTLTTDAGLDSTVAEPTNAQPDGRSATATSTVSPSADTFIQVEANSPTITPGTRASWTVTAINAGPSTAHNVTVTAVAPTGTTNVTLTGPAGSTCTAATLTCTVPALTPGKKGSAEFTLSADVPSSFADQVLDATTSVAANETDPEPGDNTATASTPVSPEADLKVAVDVTPQPIVAGGPVTITATVTNSGPSHAPGTTFTLPVPNGVQNVTVDAPAGVTCDNTVACTVGDLPVGDIKIVLHGTVSPTYTDKSLTVTASASSDAGDGNPDDNTITTTADAEIQADLGVTASVNPTTLVAGSPVTITATVKANGPSTANDVVFHLPIPPALRDVQVTAPNGVSCDPSVNCSIGTMVPAAESTITVRGTLASDYTDGDLSLTASVNSSTPDDNTANNTATITAAANSSANLSVVTTADPTPLTAGSPVTLSSRIHNDGPSTATSVVFGLPVPTGLTDVVVSAPSGVTCDNTVKCTAATLAPGQDLVIVVGGRVKPDVTDSSLTVTSNVTSPVTDPTPADNSSTVTAGVGVAGDVSVALAVDPNPLVAGSPLTVTATVHNAGPSTATGVTFTLPVPAGLVGITVVAPNGVTCDNSVSCTVGTIGPDTDTVITVRGRVAPTYTGPAIALTGTANTGSPDPTPANNSTTATTPVGANAGLAMNLVVDPATVTPGTPVTATATVHNGGPSTAANAVVTIPVPAGLTTVTVTAPNGVTCDNTVRCTIGAIDPNADVVITVTGTVDPAYAANSITFTGSSTSDTPDGNPADDSATVTKPVAAAADLGAAITLNPTNPVAGKAVDITADVVNHGPSTAVGATLNIPVPAGITNVTVSAPAGVTCDSGVFCTVGTLAPGASTRIVLHGTVAPDVTAPVSVTATATSQTPDPTPDNNSATATGTTGSSADLAFTAQVTPNPITAGTAVTVATALTNNGPSTATSVTFSVPVPNGVTNVTVDAPNGVTCDNTVKCTAGSIAPGTTVNVVVHGTVAPNVTAPVTFTGSASSPVTDPNTADNSFSTTGNVTTAADLGVTVNYAPGAVVAGAPVAATVVVRNAGPSTAAGTTVSVPVPAGLTNVTVDTPNGVTCDNTVSCTFGNLAPGASAQITVHGTIAPDYAKPDLALTATAATTATDPSAADNTATATAQVGTAANLKVSSTLDPTTLTAGSPFSFVTTIDNSGPSYAAGTTFTLPVPAGVTGIEVIAPAGVTCDNTVKCTVGAVAPGSPVKIEVRGTVDPAFTGPSISLTASAGSSTTDPDQTDNSTTVTANVSVAADIKVVVSPNPLSVASGAPFSVTLTARNNGPSTATGVTLNLPIPNGVENVTVIAPNGVTCDNTVACTVGTLAPNTQVDVQVQARVAQSFTGNQIVFTGVVASPTPDQNTGDNTTTIPLQTNATADLSASTVVNPTTGLIAGQPVTATTTIRNAGPSQAVGATFTLPVPAGLTDVTVDAPAGVTCDNTVKCTIGTINSGDQLVITVHGTVDPAFTGSSLTLDTNVSSPTPDPDPTGNSSSTTVPVGVNADLAAKLTVNPSSLTAGSAFTATATLTNAGPSTATNATFAIPVPAGVGTVTVEVPSGGVTCDTTVNCTAATVPPGANVVVIVRGTVAPDFTGNSLPFRATASSPTPDATPGNNSTSYDAATASAAAVSVNTVVDPGTLTAGSPFTATTTIHNDGPSVAAGVALNFPIPVGAQNIQVTTPAGVTCDNTVSCAVGQIASGADVVVVVRGTVSPNYTGSTITFNATETSSTPDPAQADNSASVAAPVAVTADLGVAVTADQTAVTAGSPIAVTAAVSNAGPSTATAVKVTLSVPAGLTNFTVDAPAGVTCDNTVACTIDSIAAGATVAITLRGTVDPTFTGPGLSFTGATSSAAGDPSSAGNTATLGVPVSVAADLAVTSLTAPTAVAAGTPVTITATLRNNGPSTATGATFSLPVPAAVTGVQATGPAGVTCDTTVSCTLGTLAPNAEITIAITGTVSPTYTGSGLTFTGALSSPSPDPTPGNNTATATTTTSVTPDLAVTSTLDSPTVTAGTAISNTVTIKNNGPSAAGAFTVNLAVPDGVDSVNVTAPSGVTCVARSLSCSVDGLAPGASLDIVISGVVAPDYTGPQLSFVANVTPPAGDVSSADNTATATATVSASANVTLTAALTPSPLTAGSPAKITAKITNTGPSTATGVTFTLPIPPGIQNVVVTAPNGVTCDPTVRCTVDTLAPGASLDITVDALVAPDANPAAITLTASAGSATPDPDHGDDQVVLNSNVTASADLSLKTTFDPATLTAGSPFTATTVISNAGPSTATGVTFTLPVPPGVEGVTVTAPPGVTCDNTVKCTIGDVAPGTDITIVVTGKVSPTTTQAPTFTTTVSSPTPGPNQGDRTVTTTPPLTVSSDLATTLVLDPTAPVAGTAQAATVTVRNNGPSTATGVVVTIPVPSSLTGVTFQTPTGVTCDATGTCVIDNVAPGTAVAIVLRGTVDPAATGNLTLNAAATSATTDPTPTDNSAGVNAPIAARADLVAAATVTSTNPTAGSPVTITATVRNDGPSTATGVTLTVPLPPGLQNVQVTAPAGVTCDPTVACTIGTLAPGKTVTVTIQGTIAPDAGGPLDLTATAASDTPDADPSDNTVTATSAVSTTADLKLTSQITPDRLVAGSSATITTNVTNAGPSTANNVVVSVPVPAGLQDYVVTAPTGVDCDTTVKCTITSLAPNGSVQILVTGTVAPEQTAPLNSAVTATSDANDPNEADNTVTLSEPVASEADLSLVMNFQAASLTAGSPAVVIAKARNAGPSTAKTARLALGLPGEFQNITIVTRNGVTCDTTVQCELGDMAPGAEITVEVHGVFSSDVAGDATVVGLVESPTPDPVPGNESVIVSQAVNNSTDVSLTKTAPSQITAGQDITWNLAVHVDGPSDARDVVVVDPLPKGVTPVTADPACAIDNGTVRCPLGNLTQGTDRTLTITAHVDPDFGGDQLDNAASVTTSSNDSDVTNDTATASTDVRKVVDLGIDKTLSPQPVVPGQQATFTLEVVDFGPSTATNVLVTDPIGAGMTPVSATSTLGDCAINGQIVTCTPGTVTTDDDVFITIVVDIDPAFVPNEVSNTATVVSDVTDADPSDNTVSIAGSAAPLTDLTIGMTADQTGYHPGDPITWLLTITNNGSSQARGVVVTDQLPASVGNVTVPTGCTLTGRALVCSLADLAAGDSTTLTVTGVVNADATSGTILNTASVASSTAEQNPSDNLAGTTSTLNAQADLVVGKAVENGPVVAGKDTTWLITVQNVGTGAAADVQLTDALPSGATYSSATGGTCTATDDVVHCSIGTVAAGTTTTVRVVAAIDPGFDGDTITNSVVATSVSPDANTADDTAVTTDPIRRQTALAVVKTADKTKATVGDQISWLVSLSNTGPSTAPAVSVTDKLPAGVTLITAITSTGTYDPATGAWRLDAIAPGEQPTLRVTARVDKAGSLVNIASLTAQDVLDSASADDTASATTEVSAQGGTETSTSAATTTTASPTTTTTTTTSATASQQQNLSYTGVPVLRWVTIGLLLTAAGVLLVFQSLRRRRGRRS
ncbi:CARDB domain-containing protein [Actinokineospora inagensis]|uniref:CARDB domain-containing protein n=1 Tax=Actinokineospora inagensis TaxID=103730 RepID=UPI00040CB189|nr:CARDB domain-containing protein [Actinokineospora inagensis]